MKPEWETPSIESEPAFETLVQDCGFYPTTGNQECGFAPEMS